MEAPFYTPSPLFHSVSGYMETELIKMKKKNMKGAMENAHSKAILLQDKLVQRDFNIEQEAGGVRKPAIKVQNISVDNNRMEIRLSWGGKGTTRIPHRGVYGPLISAISVISGE